MARRIAFICSLLAATAATGALGAQASGETTAATATVKVVQINMSPTCKTSIFCYKPGAITVPHGTTVVWLNVTAAPHTVTGFSGGPHSGTLLPGEPYTFRFKSPGSFGYYCQIHGAAVMSGTVNVT